MLGALYAQDQGNQAKEPDFYTQLLDSQATTEGRLRVVRAAAADGAKAEFFAYALDNLFSTLPSSQSSSHLRETEELLQFLVIKLGEEKHTAAGPNLWKVYITFSNPIIRAEALASLGKIQAADYLPRIIDIIKEISIDPGTDRIGREQIAYGAIASLEEYKESDGYLPVFLVSAGWYSDRLKNRAREVMPKIMDDPSEPLISVLKGSTYNLTVKFSALQTLEGSDATAQQKSKGAVTALDDAWKTTTNNNPDRLTLIRLRKLSIDMIRRYGTEDTNIYHPLQKSYREGVDEEEQIYVIAALSALATDDSVRILSNFLREINDRQSRGVPLREDERLVRVIIPALGSTGKSEAKNALREVIATNWTNAVHVLAQDALKKIP
jgi:hypothetical protein